MNDFLQIICSLSKLIGTLVFCIMVGGPAMATAIYVASRIIKIMSSFV